MSNYQRCNDGPLGFIKNDRLLAILQALALTDCDRRTLGIVAQATGLGEWWREVERVERAVYLLEGER